MYEASDLFKNAITQPNRELRMKCTIEGVEYSGSDVQQCSIEESILTSEEFKFGSATASTFEITLLNMDDSLTAKSFEGKELNIEIGAVLDKFHRPIEYVSLGYFIVEEATKEKNTIRLIGYDRMIYFEKPYISSLTYPATLLQITQEICSLAGVSLENTTFLNADFVVNYTPDLEEVTLRKALEYVTELATGFACINRSGKLEIISLTSTNTTIDTSNHYSMNLSEYTYKIDKLVINNDGIVEERGTGTNILEIKDNIYGESPTSQLLDNIYNNVNGFEFKPFNCAWQGNVLTAPGDKITVSNKSGEMHQSFIAKQKFEYSSGLKCNVETRAKTKLQVDYGTKGTVAKSLDRVKAEIKNLGNEINLRVTKTTYDTDINDDTNGLKVRMSSAEQKITADAIVSTVRTSTAYATDLSGKTDTTTTDGIDTRLTSAESTISQHATEISLRVQKDNVISEINQTAETIKIQASKIDFEGVSTFKSASDSYGYVQINGNRLSGNDVNDNNMFHLGTSSAVDDLGVDQKFGNLSLSGTHGNFIQMQSDNGYNLLWSKGKFNIDTFFDGVQSDVGFFCNKLYYNDNEVATQNWVENTAQIVAVWG